MELSDTAIKEFRRLYKEHFGKAISYEQAKLDGLALLKLVGRIQPKNMKMGTNSGQHNNS
jgi:hypothetical protein